MKNILLKRTILKLSALSVFLFLNSACSKIKVSEMQKEEALSKTMVLDQGSPGQPEGELMGGPIGTSSPVVPPGMDNPMPGMENSMPGMGNPMPGMPVAASGEMSQPVILDCPSSVHTGRDLARSKDELKLVYVDTDGHLICEVQNVRTQILTSKRIDTSSCKDSLSKVKFAQSFVVEKAVTKDYSTNSFNMMPGFYTPSANQFAINLIYTFMEDTQNLKQCDMVGDPLLVQLRNQRPQPVQLTSAANGVLFDLLGRKASYQKVQTAWLTTQNTESYFLALPNERGEINGIDQLFGDATLGPDGRLSKHGFAALAKFDSNHDHSIDLDDPVFLKLRLWKDSNLDGVAQPEEIFNFEQKGIVSIDLKYDSRYQEVDRYGNKTKFKSIVVMQDGSYSLIYDLWLTYLAR